MDYEVEVEVDGVDYMVYANLARDGSYSWAKDGAGQEWLDVESDPKFTSFVVFRCEDDLHPLKAWDIQVRKKAEEIMTEIYWDRIS